LLLAFYNTVTTNVGQQVERQLGASAPVFEKIIAEKIIALGDKAPNVVAWIALGVELDEVAAQEIKSLSPIDLEIEFFYTKIMQGITCPQRPPCVARWRAL